MMVKGQKGWSNGLGQHLDKVICLGGVGYLLVVSLWLFQQNRFPWIGSSDRPVLEPQKIPPSAKKIEEQRFIVYLQQALKGLQSGDQITDGSQNDRQAEKVPSPSESSGFATIAVPPPQTLPSPALGNTPVGSNSMVIERYYYPVYPTANNPAPNQPSIATQSLLALPKNPSSGTVRPSRSIVSVKPPPAQLNSFSAPQSVPPVLAKPAGSQAIAPMATGKVRYALVGVLESGDRSSALFNWNNLTQRLQIGDPIGSSGWVLTGVASQKAILTRAGAVRYLEVGESF